MANKILTVFLLLLIISFIVTACGETPSKNNTSSLNGEDASNGSTPNGESDIDPNGETGLQETNGESSDLPDLTGETITLFFIGDTSEPFTSITEPIRDGADDYLAYLNDTGGLFGATVELRFANSGGSEEGMVTAYERFNDSDDDILMLFLFGPNEETLYGRVNEDRTPTLAFGLSPSAQDADEDDYVFHLTPTYPGQFTFFLDFVLNKWEDVKPEGAIDEIKVAYLSWANEYGQSALTDETRAYAESLRIEIVWEETFEKETSASTTAAILNAEMAGATVIYTNTHAYGPAALLNDLNNLAIRNFFVVGGNNWALDAATFTYLADPAFAYEFYAPFWYAWWSDSENPAIQLAEDILEINKRSEEEKTAGRLLVQGGLDLARYAIEQAILEVGFENLTGEDVYNMLSQISGYEVMGGLFYVDYSNGNRFPTTLQIRQAQGDSTDLEIMGDFTEIPELNP
jgi:ABC-type branched-subunit amino acid transport system substrate-binding protein